MLYAVFCLLSAACVSFRSSNVVGQDKKASALNIVRVVTAIVLKDYNSRSILDLLRISPEEISSEK